MRGLPSATEGSVEVAKLTTGICIAITSVFLPGVGLLGPIAEFAINKFVKRPEAILVDELKRGNLEILDVENAAAVGSQQNTTGLEMPEIQESLSDLSARGLLIAEGATRWDKGEEYYYPSSSFTELIENAKKSLVESISECAERRPAPAQ
jgi:hypothetical protein